MSDRDGKCHINRHYFSRVMPDSPLVAVPSCNVLVHEAGKPRSLADAYCRVWPFPGRKPSSCGSQLVVCNGLQLSSWKLQASPRDLPFSMLLLLLLRVADRGGASCAPHSGKLGIVGRSAHCRRMGFARGARQIWLWQPPRRSLAFRGLRRGLCC